MQETHLDKGEWEDALPGASVGSAGPIPTAIMQDALDRAMPRWNERLDKPGANWECCGPASAGLVTYMERVNRGSDISVALVHTTSVRLEDPEVSGPAFLRLRDAAREVQARFADQGLSRARAETVVECLGTYDGRKMSKEIADGTLTDDKVAGRVNDWLKVASWRGFGELEYSFAEEFTREVLAIVKSGEISPETMTKMSSGGGHVIAAGRIESQGAATYVVADFTGRQYFDETMPCMVGTIGVEPSQSFPDSLYLKGDNRGLAYMVKLDEPPRFGTAAAATSDYIPSVISELADDFADHKDR